MTTTINLSPIPLTRLAIECGGLRLAARGMPDGYVESVVHLIEEGWLRFNKDTMRAEPLREGRHQVAVDDLLAALEQAERMSGSDWDDLLSDVEAIRLMEEDAG